MENMEDEGTRMRMNYSMCPSRSRVLYSEKTLVVSENPVGLSNSGAPLSLSQVDGKKARPANKRAGTLRLMRLSARG